MTRPPDPQVATLLQQVRESVRRGLDRIEALAREDLAASSATGDEVRRRLAELDEARERLRAEVEDWERRKMRMIEELDADRRLLAEAWERLEREQVEGRLAPAADAVPARLPTQPLSPAVATPTGEGPSPISQAVLRQFESLRRDVRRRASGGR